MKGQHGYIDPEAVKVYSPECLALEVAGIDHKS